VLCGSLEVSEDRAAGAGRKVALKVAVAPALAPQPQPDPLFVLAGGPGQSATAVASQLLPLLERLRRRRAIVFVDQRGTGGSNPLDCLEQGRDATLPEMLSSELPADALTACLARYEADVRHYTTSATVEDLEEVREALGARAVNLYGISYGTRVALEYLRRHGGSVRTATLDGVAPMSLYLPLSVAGDAQAALERLFGQCAADAACGKAFPGLQARFVALLAQLEKAPARVTAPDPVTGAPVSLTVGPELFVGNVRALLYSSEASVLVPLVVQRAAEGDWRPFLGVSAQVAGGFARGLSVGLFLSVVCSEDAPFLTEAQVRQAAAGTWAGPGSGLRLLEACRVWPRGGVPADFREPVRSEVPVLLLSGELDPVTPPRWGEEALRTLRRGRHVVVPAVGHNTLGHTCGRDLMRAFVEAGDVQGLPAEGCASGPGRPPFFLNFAGPTP
jgi:pimeloyl-ACP methyl ester carboxylesterase